MALKKVLPGHGNGHLANSNKPILYMPKVFTSNGTTTFTGGKKKYPRVKKGGVISQDILDRGLQVKKWIRLDDLYSRRNPWKTAKFVADDFFLTRLNHRHGTCLYHICGMFGKWVFYCLVPRDNPACMECDKVVDEGVMMLNKLRRMKR